MRKRVRPAAMRAAALAALLTAVSSAADAWVSADDAWIVAPRSGSVLRDRSVRVELALLPGVSNVARSSCLSSNPVDVDAPGFRDCFDVTASRRRRNLGETKPVGADFCSIVMLASPSVQRSRREPERTRTCGSRRRYRTTPTSRGRWRPPRPWTSGRRAGTRSTSSSSTVLLETRGRPRRRSPSRCLSRRTRARRRRSGPWASRGTGAAASAGASRACTSRSRSRRRRCSRCRSAARIFSTCSACQGGNKNFMVPSWRTARPKFWSPHRSPPQRAALTPSLEAAARLNVTDRYDDERSRHLKKETPPPVPFPVVHALGRWGVDHPERNSMPTAFKTTPRAYADAAKMIESSSARIIHGPVSGWQLNMPSSARGAAVERSRRRRGCRVDRPRARTEFGAAGQR